MPAPGMTYKKLRRQLDDLGYYQPLVPEAAPLVEALLHDLLGMVSYMKSIVTILAKKKKKSSDFIF